MNENILHYRIFKLMKMDHITQEFNNQVNESRCFNVVIVAFIINS